MVSTSALLAMIFTLVLTLIGPIVVLIFYGVRHKKEGVWSSWGLGALGFFVMQVVIRMPILSVLSLIPGFVDFANENYVIYVLLLAFTAGLFELVGRYVVAKFMAKNLTYNRSVAAGLGHGGIEAIVLVGMTYINNLLYAVMINTGAMDALIDQLAPVTDIGPYISIKNALVSTPAYLYLFAGYERVLTIICHVAMTLVVCYFVSKKQDLKGILICLGMHTVLDAASGLISYYFPAAEWGYVLVYGFLTLMAVVSVVIICRIAGKFKNLVQS